MLDLTERIRRFYQELFFFLLSDLKEANKNPALCLLTGKQIQLKIFAQLSLQEMGNLLLFHGELEQARKMRAITSSHPPIKCM